MSAVPVVELPPQARLDTLPAWPWHPHDASAPMTLGWAAAEWAESLLIQPNGPRAGRPFRFTPGQLRFLLWWYALDDQGHWLFQHGVRRLAKGSGKSPFAAVLALIEFCGPVRLARKDDRLPGRCGGKPVDMPWVQIAATAESQTANTMRMVRAFAPKGSKVVELYWLDPGKTRYYRQPEGTLEVITSSFTAAEGAESSFVVGDETEHWKPANGGPDLASTLEDNLAKSGARMLETSNAWVPGLECVAEATWDGWLAQEEGRLQREAGRMLYDARMASPDVDLANYESLAEALAWIYGDCDWKRAEDGSVDVAPIIKRIWSPRAKPSESLRKYLNRPTVEEDAWTSPEEWSALIDLNRVVSPKEPVVLFFDGSKSRDATAVVGCCLSDGHVFVPRWAGTPSSSTIWEPDPKHTTESQVDAKDVDLALSHVFANHRVVAFFGDVNEWESFVKVEWPKRFGRKLQLDAVKGTRSPQKIAWDMRNHTAEFTRAAELVEGEITERTFTHDGNPVLARHVANMRRWPNRYGVSVGKESPSSSKKVDAGVCMVGARMVRELALAAGVGKKQSRGVPRRVR